MTFKNVWQGFSDRFICSFGKFVHLFSFGSKMINLIINRIISSGYCNPLYPLNLYKSAVVIVHAAASPLVSAHQQMLWQTTVALKWIKGSV